MTTTGGTDAGGTTTHGTDAAWNPGTATAVGSMPGTDPFETARVVAGELPDLLPFPELPARGVGADMLGRTAGLLQDLPVELAPSGYRVAARPGRDQRRAVDLLRWDLDAVHAATEAGYPQRTIKVQAAGPWTMAAGIELARGHRVLTDHGALRDFTESLTEGLVKHVTDVATLTGARVVVQLDEPTLPAVLDGILPTPSGYGVVPAVPEPEARRLLADLIAVLTGAVGTPVIVHSCAPRPPVGLLHRAGAGAISIDARGLGSVSGGLADELGEVWQEGLTLFLGLVPTDPGQAEPGLRDLAQPAKELISRLGFPARVLAEQSLPTPACGLAKASVPRARRALTLTNELARIFADEAYG